MAAAAAAVVNADVERAPGDRGNAEWDGTSGSETEQERDDVVPDHLAQQC